MTLKTDFIKVNGIVIAFDVSEKSLVPPNRCFSGGVCAAWRVF
jgi:hypothetical protein